MNNSISLHEFEAAFIGLMATNGLTPESSILQYERIIRFSADKNRSKKDEWYWCVNGLSERENVYFYGVYGSWSAGTKFEYNSWKEQRLDERDIQEFRRIHKERREEVRKAFEEQHESAAKKAKKIYDDSPSTPPSQEYTNYLKAKNIEHVAGLKYGLSPEGNPSIIIPMFNIQNDIRSLQWISPNKKKFIFGGEKKGNFFSLGNETPIIYIAEGFATAASIHKATNCQVVVAFDCGNLLPVAENIKKKNPQAQVIITGDNDWTRNPNQGKEKALEAGRILNCPVVIPEFPKDKNTSQDGKPYTDFNDLYTVMGQNETRMQLEQRKEIRDTPTTEKKRRFITDDPCADFNLDMSPTVLGDFVREQAKHTNAHPVIIFSSALCSVAAIIGRRIYVPGSNDEFFQDLYPNLWCISVAESGQYKTTALNKGALLALERSKEAQERMKEIDSSNMEVARKEELKLAESLNDPILPTKITAEAFLDYLGHGHTGMMLSSEFQALLQSMQKKYNSDFKAILTDFYDVPHTRRYVTKGMQRIINRPMITICGVSTATMRIDTSPEDMASGFLPRFLFFAPPKSEGIPPFLPQRHNIDYASINRFRDAVNNVVHLIDTEGGTREYSLSPEARIFGAQIHEQLFDLKKECSSRMESIIDPFIKRWSPYLIKIALLYELLDNPNSCEISGASILKAENFLMTAVRSTIKLFSGELGESEFQRSARLVYEYIAKRSQAGETAKYSRIVKSEKLNGNTKEYDEVLMYLESTEQIVCINPGVSNKKLQEFKTP